MTAKLPRAEPEGRRPRSPPCAFPRKSVRVEHAIVRPLVSWVAGGLLVLVTLATRAEAGPKTSTASADRASSRVRAVEAALLTEGDPATRIAAATLPLLGAPYVTSPLGEGQGLDPDPRFRLDAFDCTTFVETSLALASSRTLDEAKAKLDRIRYSKAEATFQTRRHLVTSQWVPGLVDLGLLVDVTATVAGFRASKLELELTPKRWRKRWVARTLPLDESSLTFGAFEIPIVPIDALTDPLIARRVPIGTVVNVVRAPYNSAPDFVTHQGIVLRDPKQPDRRIVRHASPVRGRVIDEPIESMARRYGRPKKWAVVGLQFLEIVGTI
ncbi:MAG: DUF1460 domain-containing protein [Deltaproteobacteria bacterium]|nr:DUF1460 domain-containing protein [Deltaproteobacteria bacterium]